MVMDQQGNPVCSEMWPGNASDGKSLVSIVERLQTRFPVGQVSIVADRGRISADTLGKTGWIARAGVWRGGRPPRSGSAAGSGAEYRRKKLRDAHGNEGYCGQGVPRLRRRHSADAPCRGRRVDLRRRVTTPLPKPQVPA